MKYQDILLYKKENHSLRFITKDNFAFIAAFLFREFVDTGVQTIDSESLERNLTDYIYSLDDSAYESAADKPSSYLNQWANEGILRKYYVNDSDNPVYELTPSSIRTLGWITSLETKDFIGTESRLLKIFDLLKEIAYKTSDDAEIRMQELSRDKEKIELEMAKLKSGVIEKFDSTQIKERYFDLVDTASALISDFRQVEYNFRDLDRKIRGELADNNRSKGAVVENFFSVQDSIWDSDQGRSFKSFWELLLSVKKLEELDSLLKTVLELPEIAGLKKDNFLVKFKYNLIDSGGKVNRTINLLIEQLARFLDSKSFDKSKYILELIKKIEANALKLRDSGITSEKHFIEIIDKPYINSFLSRPYYTLQEKMVFSNIEILDDTSVFSTDFIYDQIFIDRDELLANIEVILSRKEQAKLSDIVAEFPVKKGISEVVEYYNIALDSTSAFIDEESFETIAAENISAENIFTLKIPLIVFNRI